MRGLRVLALWATVCAIALLFASCGGSGKGGDADGDPTGQATEDVEATAATVEVNALDVSQGPEGFAGAVAVDRIRVEPSDQGELRVSFAETEVDGLGPSLTSSGWTAIAVASLLLGIDPRQYEFTFEPAAGLVDGNSSSGLYTVGVLAALLGEEPDPDTAMTGGINPDGSIGPVGGIPHKIAGAAEADMARVVVPAMQRFDTDLNTGESVDLIELGESLGVEVVPASTVYEAYEILTGSPLPQPAGVGAADLPANAFARLKAAAIEWLGRYDAAVSRFLALTETYGFEEDILLGQELADAAANALEQGLAAVAYERAFSAGSLAEGALQSVALADAYIAGGLDGLIAEVAALSAVETRLSATLERLESESPRSATDALALTDAYSNVAIAFGLTSDAASLIQLLETVELTEDEALDLIFSIATSYSEADFFLEAAENNLVYGLGFGEATPPDPQVVTAIAETMRRAADANLALIDSLILDQAAQAFGISTEDARSFLLSIDPDYGSALGSSMGTTYFRDVITGEPQASIAVLGGSLSAWATSSIVLAKYYALGPEFDENFYLIGFTRERALSDMLDLANGRAEELITLVAAEDPVTALYYYENARSYREGTQFDKVSALFYSWQAAVFGEALAYFNGTFDAAISSAGASPLWEWGAVSADPNFRVDVDSDEGNGSEDTSEAEGEPDQ
jgi:uncharacterized protein